MKSHNTDTVSSVSVNLLYRQDIEETKKQIKEMIKRDNRILLSFMAIGRNVLRVEILANDPYDLNRLYVSFTFEHKGIPIVVQDTENYSYKKLLSTYSYLNNEIIRIVEKHVHIAINYMKEFNKHNTLSFLNGTKVGAALRKDESIIWPITNKARIELKINRRRANITAFLNGYKKYSNSVGMDLLSNPKYDGRQALRFVIIILVHKIYKKDLPNIDKNIIDDVIADIISDFDV
jgi:hypothetical protein